MIRAGLVLFVWIFFTGALCASPEVFEVGVGTFAELPGGREADGIVGDFLLRNDRIEAVVSCDAPLRKADMGTYWDAVAPGCLFDLTLRGTDNDQLTVFAPCGQKGPVSYVRIVRDGSDGEACVEVVESAVSNDGVFKRHEYRLRDGWQGLLITTTLRNESELEKKIRTSDHCTHLSSYGAVGKVLVGDAIDPDARVGYAFAWVPHEEVDDPGKEVVLSPGEEIEFARFLAVGGSPAEAYGLVVSRLTPTGILAGRIEDPEGRPIQTAAVDIVLEEGKVRAYPKADGTFRLRVPVGTWELRATDRGRSEVTEQIVVYKDKETPVVFQMDSLSGIRFAIHDENGKSLPCKVQFHGVEGTPSPDLGPVHRAHGCRDQYHSETGDFQVALDPGTYRVIVTHGIEYSHLEKKIELKKGEIVEFEGILKRLVDTTGWVSTDFHNHSTQSGDNVCGTDDRVINLAAEQVEFAPTTEHNRLYDWTPHIKKLGLEEEISTIPGIELTGSGEHLNAFPFEPNPMFQDGGAPVWQHDPRLNAIVLRNYQGPLPDRWVHLNHPDMVEDFVDWDQDGKEDGGYPGLARLVDGAETWSSEILADAPYRIGKNSKGEETVIYNRTFIWLQMLNRGHKYTCIAVSDAHQVYGNGVGGWRTYIPSSTDKPKEIDWKEIIRNAKAGRAVVTTGPFLEVTADDGTLPGGSTRASGSIRLNIRVQCSDWIDINRIQILVNGRKPADLNFTRKSHPDWFQDGIIKFERTIEVPLSRDSHLIVVAFGEGLNLKTGYGTSSQGTWPPCAYTNPIFVDTDGGGFTPNMDDLGFSVPVKKMKVEEVKRLLAKLEK